MAVKEVLLYNCVMRVGWGRSPPNLTSTWSTTIILNVLPHVILLPNASSPMLPIHGDSGDTAARHPGVLRICACWISPRNLDSNPGNLPARSAGGAPVRNDADVLTGNVSGEAMTPDGNIFADAMRADKIVDARH